MAGWAVPGAVQQRQVHEDPVGRRVLARHPITRKALAITYLSPDLLADAEFRARFAGECARLTRLRQAGVARVYRYVDDEQGVAVIGEYINGSTLRSLLRAHGAIGPEAALVVLKDMLLALAACHRVGLAHGDVKPDNVILTPAGRARLFDFGLWTADGRRRLAQSTPFYLAPEQWSRAATSRANGDVYAATVTFFECLVGAPPFYAADAAQLATKHQGSTAPVEVLPEAMRELVLRGLAKDPGSRPDAGSLLAAVSDVAARATEPGWERRGRRELAAYLAPRSTLAEISALSRKIGATRHVGYGRHIRLAAVVGGALALAAGLSSPPLAVIPGVDIFGSGGRPPVLAFPEPDRGPVAMRVVTNGRPADRAPASATKLGTGAVAAGARPPASPIPEAKIHTAPYEQTHPDTHPQRPALPEGASAESSPGRSTRACTGQVDAEIHPCTRVNREQQTPDSDESPSEVSIPVALPAPLPPLEVPVQLAAPVRLPLPVVLAVPVEKPVENQKSLPTQDKAWPDKDFRAGRSFSYQVDSQVPRKTTVRAGRPHVNRDSFGPPRTLSQKGPRDFKGAGKTGTR